MARGDRAVCNRFVYRPADPTPAVGGPLITGHNKQRINRTLERRPDVAARVALWPTGYRFRRGHQTGAPVASAVATRPTRLEVRHGPHHPSHLLLPVHPGRQDNSSR